MFRFQGADGTVYYTNAPTDPAYQRMGFVSGTKAGWLRPPAPEATVLYLDHARRAAERYGVPEKLISAVIRVESGFNARAVSPKGARGLMQLMPETASLLGVRDSFDPADNIDGGVRHLRQLLDRFNSVSLALAAYNAGEHAVTQYRGIPPFAETQGYVQKVLAYFHGDDATARAAASMTTYKLVANDGTITYTNIPPAGRR